jgi:hypothetical protein
MSIIQQLQIIAGNTPLSRRRALLGLSLLALTACSRSAQETKAPDSNVAYYTCAMHGAGSRIEGGGGCQP